MQLLKPAHSLKNDLYFLFCSASILLLLQSLTRAMLLWYNFDLADSVPAPALEQAFLVGAKFDLVITGYVLMPLVLMLIAPAGIPRKAAVLWLSLAALIITFLAVVELDFYREFHVRLNSLAIQYLSEDPATVISMIWHGYPVLTYLAAVLAIAVLFYAVLFRLGQRCAGGAVNVHYSVRLLTFFAVALVVVISARGTLRQGPPLRWGDAFHSDYLFANHLALNGPFTLTKAILNNASRRKNQKWLTVMPQEQAVAQAREMILTGHDRLLTPGGAALWRQYTPVRQPAKKPLNVVLILMESFSAEFIDSFGHDYGITPEFDRLRKKGLLFENFFSNGTHTHQGMFASMACFPNLPGHEYLMQQPEGDRDFKGMLSMLSDRHYQSLYVYNGDFNWDNQQGFFTRQGMDRFIGRHDFINPKFSDPTWGVSDEDMFNRAAEELARLPKDKPFFAFLQTLSNHTPYALPSPLPVTKVTGFGRLDEHLTAMKYADWALGRFFEKIKNSDFYDNTLFVIVGDHGFGTEQQLTGIDLLRFHVLLLILGGGVQPHYGDTSQVVGAQVDIVPTVAGLLGGKARYGCWGRDLLNVSDKGFAIIKPSGSDQTTAIIKDDMILVRSAADSEQLYRYRLNQQPEARLVDNASLKHALSDKLLAYIQAASSSLSNPNEAGLPVMTQAQEDLTQKEASISGLAIPDGDVKEFEALSRL